MHKYTIAGALTVLTIGALFIAYALWNAPAHSFRLIEIKPIVVVETRLSGEQISYKTYQASVAGYPGAAQEDMFAYSEQIFTNQIRSMADRDGASQVWFTFYLEPVVVDGKQLTKTFRTIFAREAAGWRRMEKPAKKEDGATL